MDTSETRLDASWPTAATVEAWCREFLSTRNAELKLHPPKPPDANRPEHWEVAPEPLRFKHPSRPLAWNVVGRSPKTPRRGAMIHPEQRAHIIHTLAHHELQAAELFAWAILAFPDSPLPFRQGLLRLAQEELGHLALYLAHLRRLGSSFGTLSIRDWIWSRAMQCTSPIEFVAFLGIGLEGSNLEHTKRFATWFRDAGDEDGAAILAKVEHDEVSHVAFACHWYAQFAKRPLEFEAWSALLPKPLTAVLFRGLPLNFPARLAAGLSESFLAQLSAPEEDRTQQP